MEREHHRNQEAQSPEEQAPERWTPLLDKLGIRGTDEFEVVVIDFLQSGLLNLTEVGRIIDQYVARAEELDAPNRRYGYYELAKWHPELGDAELLAELRRMVPEAGFHDIHAITDLHDEAMTFQGGEEVARDLIQSWLVAFRRRREEVGNREFDPNYNFYRRKVHPDIEAEIRGLQARQRARTTVLDVSERWLRIGLGARGKRRACSRPLPLTSRPPSWRPAGTT